MKDFLLNHFIEIDEEYKEGIVYSIIKDINIKKNIKKAILYSTSFGMYEVLVNNKIVDDQLFKPGFTDYKKRLLYQTVDITTSLINGNNNICFLLGQGWYSGRYLCENKVCNFGDKVSISYCIDIYYEDNSKEQVYSSDNDPYYNSKYIYAGLYDGEVYDDFIEIKKLGNCKLITPPKVDIDCTLTKVKLQEEMKPISINKNLDKTIIDFGQNMAGIIVINTSLLHKEDVITIRHGEILNPDGSLYTLNLRKAKATISYKQNNSSFLYTTHFTYMGFRYIEISGVDYIEALIKCYFIHTDMDRIGEFKCNNQKVQRLYDNVLWSQRSNYVEIPTDCPQRDERLGYTGDGHVFFKTGSYNYDTRNFFENFFTDLRLGQLQNSDYNVPPYLPQTSHHEVGFMTMQGWGSAVSIIPIDYYIQYGDIDFLKDNFDAIKKYVDLEISKCNKEGLWIGISLGDWLSPNKGIAYQAMHNHSVSNAFFIKDLKNLLYIMNLLNIQEDYSYYKSKLELAKSSYIKRFILPNGKIKHDIQGAYVLCLQHVLDNNDDIYNKVANQFINNVKSKGIDTGFFGTQYLLPLLADLKEDKLAIDLLLSNEYPSWMYEIDHGATTIWEKWNAIKPNSVIDDHNSLNNMVSFNHYSFGSVGQFYYEYILGIKPILPGFKKVLIKPILDKRLNDIYGSYKSVSGDIKVSYKYVNNFIQITIDTKVLADIVINNLYLKKDFIGILNYEYKEEKNE